MKKFLLSCLFLLGCTVLTFAQDAAAAVPAPVKKPKFEWTAATMTTLGLTADVQTKILDLTKAAEDEAKKLRKDKSMADEDRKAKMKEVRTTCETAIAALLSDDEKKKLKAMRKELKAQ
jgi:hypothetical protein